MLETMCWSGLETLEFDNTELGPPFSVNTQMINDYYSDVYQIKEMKRVESNEGVHKGQVEIFQSVTTFLNPKS